MGIIHEPVKSCTIIFRYEGRAPGTNNPVTYSDKFETIEQLKAYFTRMPGHAYLVGYEKKKPVPQVVFYATLHLEWVDGLGIFTGKEFASVYQFADFLKDHPALAKMVGFTPKPPRR
jgi:hypothetical protein